MNTRTCWYCKYRQRRHTAPLIDCMKHDKTMMRDEVCKDWEWRWKDNPTEGEHIKEQEIYKT